jgi:methylase of polypeptide subunit release factors
MTIAASTSLHVHPGRIAQLRSALWSAGYQTARVSEVLGADREHLQPDPAQAVLLKRQLATGDSLSTLIRLFILGLPVPPDEAARALAPLPLEHAHELGIIGRADSHVEAAIRLTPYGDFLFACSRVPDIEAVERDHVMGVTRSTINLANLTIRRPVETALDLGCGCGFQSLFASRHASRVIATDINPLAIRFTEFNARLNGVNNIECREGSYLEPVAGESFDLVVANPPFVISPDDRFMFRDGGMPGDELSRKIVAEVPGIMREGATATLMVSWGRKTGDEWEATPRQWVLGRGCDAWAFHQATQAALLHAASWHQPLAANDIRAYDAGIERWTDYISRFGFDAIAYGAIVLRRRQGTNWFRSEELPDVSTAPAGEQLIRMTEAQDLLAGLADKRALLEERFVLTGGHRLDQTLICAGGTYNVERAVLQLTEGLTFRANVDPFNAFLLTRLDGSRPLGKAIAEAAAAVPTAGMDQDEIETVALRAIRRMLELGFITKVMR